MKYACYSFAILFAAIMFSCGEKKSEDGTDTTETADAEEGEDEGGDVNKAILLWDASISDGTTKEKKWIASYQFGNTLVLTGKTEENTEEKRTYVEVTGPDGKTGWINQNLIVPNAKVGVSTAEITLYKNPDIMSISSNKVMTGDILAISSEEKNGFQEVFGKEKSIKGFVNGLDKISSEPIDLKVAIFYQKALAEKTREGQVKLLRAIIDDASNSSSQFYSLVESKLEEFNTGEEEYSAADTTSM